MAALRRMDAPAYGDWQPEPYGYPASYGGGQTLPPQTSGGGAGMGGGGTLGRSKGKKMSAGGPGGPTPMSQSKGGPKVNGNNSGGQGGWWPECTCTNRDWYDQVNAFVVLDRLPVPVGALKGGSWCMRLLGWRSCIYRSSSFCWKSVYCQNQGCVKSLLISGFCSTDVFWAGE